MPPRHNEKWISGIASSIVRPTFSQDSEAASAFYVVSVTPRSPAPRDLEPENALVDGQGRIPLSGFGLSKDPNQLRPNHQISDENTLRSDITFAGQGAGVYPHPLVE